MYASQNTKHQLQADENQLYTDDDQLRTDDDQLRADGKQLQTDQNQLQADGEGTQRLHYASYPNINDLTEKLKNTLRNENEVCIRDWKIQSQHH